MHKNVMATADSRQLETEPLNQSYKITKSDVPGARKDLFQ